MRAAREVTTGVVSKAVGLRGEVLVHPDPDLGEPFVAGAAYRTRGPSGGPGVPPTLTVAASTLHSGRRVVRFRGVADRSGAEALRGLVLVRDADAADLDEDAVWADDVVGLPVVDPDGGPLGTVAALADGPAHDYLVVGTPDGREVLVPAVAALVAVEATRVVVTPVPGLFDDLDVADPDEGSAP